MAEKLPPASSRGLPTNLKLASPRLRLIKAGAEAAPGVTTFNTAGHTPGHISVHISSGSEELLLTGDVVVNEDKLLHPEWPLGFDIDAQLGTKTRVAFLDRAAADKTLVGSYHLPSWLRARGSRGERLSLAAGGLAVDELRTTSNSLRSQFQHYAKENLHE